VSNEASQSMQILCCLIPWLSNGSTSVQAPSVMGH